MKIEEIETEKLVTDKNHPEWGIGKVERIENGLVYVWYDEVDTTIHYNDKEVEILLTDI